MGDGIDKPHEKTKGTKSRLLAAMFTYAVLAGMAGLTLEGLFRIAVLIFLGGLAIKTLIAAKIESL
jgi:hypothetical protein